MMSLLNLLASIGTKCLKYGQTRNSFIFIVMLKVGQDLSSKSFHQLNSIFKVTGAEKTLMPHMRIPVSANSMEPKCVSLWTITV